jgi:hypothetical protein
MTEETTKTDFYLKLSSEADVPTVLSAFYKQDTTSEFDPETGEEIVTNVGDPYFVQNSPDYAIDLVGIIHKPTGNILTDAEGIEYPEMAPLDGYHINIRLNGDNRREDVEALSGYFVDPEPLTPSRIWL